MKYLETMNADSRICSKNGVSSLHLVGLSNNVEAAIHLIKDLNHDPHSITMSTKSTPLHYACKNGKIKIAKYLIEKCNCDPLQKT
jgi:ankyrin repeat protein